MIGDFLYQLTERDGQSPTIEVTHRRAETAAAAAFLFIAFEIPKDKIFFLQALNVRAAPGGAQTVTNLGAYIHPAGGAIPGVVSPHLFNVTSNGTGGAASGAADVAFTGAYPIAIDKIYHDLILVPGSTLHFACNFNAGAVANSLAANIFGFMIPRGNLPAL